MSEHHTLAPLRRVSTDVLDVAYYGTGSAENDTVLLPHGSPYGIQSYVAVAPLLADSGFQVVVPHLRGHGPTRFLPGSTPRSGQRAALGADVVAFMDALGVERAYLAGHDRGGRAAKIAAALWPERVLGLVSVMIHPYRHRLGLAPGAEAYTGLEARLAKQPAITVPFAAAVRDVREPRRENAGRERFTGRRKEAP
ncbi:alpha/beta fold hydrolase [Nonomuraea sp. NPDC049419]|uniref:alpha/beta fold hydrolase n=1 Tax=Nonomuraea sp. NPDC049419 TaxID=3155772 RepID=UPI00341D98CA